MKKRTLLLIASVALAAAFALPAGAATTQPGDQPWVLTVKAPTPTPTIVAAADKAKAGQEVTKPAADKKSAPGEVKVAAATTVGAKSANTKKVKKAKKESNKVGAKANKKAKTEPKAVTKKKFGITSRAGAMRPPLSGGNPSALSFLCIPGH